MFIFDSSLLLRRSWHTVYVAFVTLRLNSTRCGFAVLPRKLCLNNIFIDDWIKVCFPNWEHNKSKLIYLPDTLLSMKVERQQQKVQGKITNTKRREEKLLSASDGAFFSLSWVNFGFVLLTLMTSHTTHIWPTVNTNASCAIESKTLASVQQEGPTKSSCSLLLATNAFRLSVCDSVC